nr:hypothetical protein [Tanacetum cinerariifolium]
MSDSEDSTVTYTTALPPSDYVPGLEEPKQAPPSPVYIPYVPEPVYPEYIPPEDDVFPAEEQTLPAAASPTAESPGYIPERRRRSPLEMMLMRRMRSRMRTMMMRRRSTQLQPTLFHLHLHSRLSIVHCPGYEAGESLVAVAARPIEGRRAEYGFVDSVEAEIRRQRAKDIGYGIRDTWIDSRDVAEEEALTTLEGANTRVTELTTVQEQDTQDIYGVMEDIQGRQTEIFQRVEALVDDSQYHYETGRHGHLATALGEIRELQAREQARAGAPEGARRSGDVSPGVDGPPVIPEDPYAYVVAAFQALPLPDYVSGPEEPKQAPPSPVYIPYVPEPVYPEYIPPEDDVFPAEEQPLPAAASPTAESPGYIPESDPDEDSEEDDDEDPEKDPVDYPADHDDDEEKEDPSGDDAGESSVAAAARPIKGRRADYGFVDSVEAEIRRRRAEDIGYGIRDTWIDPRDVAEEEALTTLEGVNTRKIAPKKAAPKQTTRLNPGATSNPNQAPSTTTTTFTNAQLQAMIDQGVNAALAARDANQTGDDSHTSRTGVRRTECVTRECTYQDFIKCQPLYFKGTEGVVELTQWFERMETVFRISNCLAENQVKFATCTLLAGALTWWNSHVRIVGNDAAYVMTWIELKKKLADKVERYIGGLFDSIYGIVAASKPKTIQEATEMATGLMDKIRTYAKRKAANKRKFEDTSRNNQGRQQPPKSKMW